MQDQQLAEPERQKLDGIVSQMVANGEPDENINAVVTDFKLKYRQPTAQPKPAPTAAPEVHYGSQDMKPRQDAVSVTGKQFLRDFPGAKVEQFGPGSIPTSLHKKGIALDLRGPDLDKYAEWAKARGAKTVIVKGRIWSASKGWRKYTGPHAHNDHVHVDWGKEGPSPPKAPPPDPSVSYGSQNENRSLKKVAGSTRAPADIFADGLYGPRKAPVPKPKQGSRVAKDLPDLVEKVKTGEIVGKQVDPWDALPFTQAAFQKMIDDDRPTVQTKAGGFLSANNARSRVAKMTGSSSFRMSNPDEKAEVARAEALYRIQAERAANEMDFAGKLRENYKSITGVDPNVDAPYAGAALDIVGGLLQSVPGALKAAHDVATDPLGSVKAMPGLMVEAMEMVNVFDPGIDGPERFKRSIMAVFTIAGAKQGLVAVKNFADTPAFKRSVAAMGIGRKQALDLMDEVAVAEGAVVPSNKTQVQNAPETKPPSNDGQITETSTAPKAGGDLYDAYKAHKDEGGAGIDFFEKHNIPPSERSKFSKRYTDEKDLADDVAARAREDKRRKAIDDPESLTDEELQEAIELQQHYTNVSAPQGGINNAGEARSIGGGVTFAEDLANLQKLKAEAARRQGAAPKAVETPKVGKEGEETVFHGSPHRFESLKDQPLYFTAEDAAGARTYSNTGGTGSPPSGSKQLFVDADSGDIVYEQLGDGLWHPIGQLDDQTGQLIRKNIDAKPMTTDEANSLFRNWQGAALSADSYLYEAIPPPGKLADLAESVRGSALSKRDAIREVLGDLDPRGSEIVANIVKDAKDGVFHWRHTSLMSVETLKGKAQVEAWKIISDQLKQKGYVGIRFADDGAITRAYFDKPTLKSRRHILSGETDPIAPTTPPIAPKGGEPLAVPASIAALAPEELATRLAHRKEMRGMVDPESPTYDPKAETTLKKLTGNEDDPFIGGDEILDDLQREFYESGRDPSAILERDRMLWDSFSEVNQAAKNMNPKDVSSQFLGGYVKWHKSKGAWRPDMRPGQGTAVIPRSNFSPDVIDALDNYAKGGIFDSDYVLLDAQTHISAMGANQAKGVTTWDSVPKGAKRLSEIVEQGEGYPTDFLKAFLRDTGVPTRNPDTMKVYRDAAKELELSDQQFADALRYYGGDEIGSSRATDGGRPHANALASDRGRGEGAKESGNVSRPIETPEGTDWGSLGQSLIDEAQARKAAREPKGGGKLPGGKQAGATNVGPEDFKRAFQDAADNVVIAAGYLMKHGGLRTSAVMHMAHDLKLSPKKVAAMVKEAETRLGTAGYESPVSKATALLSTAGAANKEQVAINREIRARQAAQLQKSRGKGEEGLKEGLQTLKGQFPKVSINPIGDKLTRLERDQLLNIIDARDDLSPQAQVGLKQDLMKMLDFGQVPTRYSIDWFRKIYGQEFVSALLKNRDVWGKTKDLVGDLVFGVMRMLTAGLDNSGTFIHGGKAFLTDNPMWRDALGKSFEAMANEDVANLINHELKLKRSTRVGVEHGLDILESGVGSVAHGEELFAGGPLTRWLEQAKIPFTDFAPVGAANRAFTTWGNVLRSHKFEQGLNLLERNGEATEHQLKFVTGLANKWSGRGSLGTGLAKNAGNFLAGVFYSPKYNLSLLQYPVTSVRGMLDPKLPPALRKQIAKDMAKYLVGTYGVMELGQKREIEVNGEKREWGIWDMNWDPESTSFLKAKVGDTRVDLTGGFGAILSAMWILSPMTDSRTTLTGKKLKFDPDKFGGEDKLEYATRWLRKKLAPGPGIVADILAQKTVIGEDVTVIGEMEERMIPFWLQDMKDAIEAQVEADGWTAPALSKGVGQGVLGFFGVRMTTFSEKGGRRSGRPSREGR